MLTHASKLEIDQALRKKVRLRKAWSNEGQKRDCHEKRGLNLF